MSDDAVTPAYVWFDSEFTGLDLEQARLLQVAMVVTDTELRRLARPDCDVNLHVRLDPDAPLDPWVANNLAPVLEQCRSPRAVSVEEADIHLAERLDTAVGPPAKDIRLRPILAGNTVHMDLALARKFLPRFTSRLHYRMLDVSTLKILWKDWFRRPPFDKENASHVAAHLPPGIEAPPGGKHDAYYDIHASLSELNFYRSRLAM